MNLPAIADARLPKSYVAAKTALAECSRIDECQEWANKAEALASYAKQAKDETLRKHAERIQARAIRRCGELLKKIEPSKGGRPANETREGVRPSSRGDVASSAGLSVHQRKTALRVASVPEQRFEGLIESDDPPTVTKLAELGTKKLNGKAAQIAEKSSRPGFSQATEAIGTLRRFAEFCRENNPKSVAAGVLPEESQEIREWVSAIDRWLDVFVTNV